jgi:hypothetical protein
VRFLRAFDFRAVLARVVFVVAAFAVRALFARRRAGLLGTLAPSRRASARPIAMACLRLVTRLPELPLFSVPRLRSRITRATFF